MSHKVDLRKLVLINLDFDIWSGQTKLQPSDLKKVSAEDLPPETLASLGSKRICSPEHLKSFHKLKARARRAVLEHGRPFMGGFLYPADLAVQIEQRLIKIEHKFITAKDTFVNGYEAAVQSWMEENPEYAEVIRDAALSRAEVAERIKFDFQIIEVAPVHSEEAIQRFDTKVRGVGEELIDEISDKANEFLEKYLLGRSSVSTQTKATLINMRDKVKALSFLNGRLAPMGVLLDDMILGYAAFSGSKHVTGDHFLKILVSALVLSDREKIARYADGTLDLKALQEKIAEQTEFSESEQPTNEETQMEDPEDTASEAIPEEQDMFF